jgi:hypothetical protein
LVLLASGFCLAQAPTAPKMRITHIEADHLGNFYYQGSLGLVKVDPEGEEMGRFSRPDLGTPTVINVYDPMRVLLYYKDFNIVIVLDNRLNPLYPPLDLLKEGYVDVPALALADEFNLWLYDQLQDRVLRMDMRDRKVRFQSLPLTQLIQRESQVSLMRSHVDGMVVLTDQGPLLFDNLGNFKAFYPLPSMEDAHWTGKRWILSNGKSFFDPQGSKVSQEEEWEFKDWTCTKDAIWILQKGGVISLSF